MFSAFDSPNQIYRIQVTKGSTGTTGTWVPETEATPIPLTGHVTDLTLEELAVLDPGMVEKGVRKFSTSELLQIGDRVRITEPGGDISTWDVHTTLHENALIQKFTGSTRARRTFLIRRP
jgi:hypothetical protein